MFLGRNQQFWILVSSKYCLGRLFNISGLQKPNLFPFDGNSDLKSAIHNLLASEIKNICLDNLFCTSSRRGKIIKSSSRPEYKLCWQLHLACLDISSQLNSNEESNASCLAHGENQFHKRYIFMCHDPVYDCGLWCLFSWQ